MIFNRKETLDVVDENDQVIGQTLRDDAHIKGLLHREVHVWVFNSKGEVLLQKRSPTKEIYPGLWDASIGGHVPSGMSYEEAALKELEEEIGIRAEPRDLIILGKTRVKVIDSLGGTNNTHDTQYAYQYDGPVENLQVEKGEATQLRFWSFTDLWALDGRSDAIIVPVIFNEPAKSIVKKVEALSVGRA